MAREKPKHPALQSLGKVVRERRKKLGMTQLEFGAVTKFHRNYIASVERGEANVTLLNLIQLCEGLGLSTSSLLKQASL